MDRSITRRALLGRAALGASSLALGSRAPWPELAGARSGAAIELPTPAQVRADFQRMVDFGPRLTGGESHNRYIAWLEQELTGAGVQLRACDSYETERWEVGRASLELLDGPGAGAVRIASYYPRSQETPPGGVSGRLVYGGVLPAPSVSSAGTDLAALQAALVRYPSDLYSWVEGLSGTLAGAAAGNILLVDLPIPLPLTLAAFLPAATFLQWEGHGIGDWLTADYKRNWLLPGLTLPLAPFQALGAAGVVFVLDSSYAAAKGAYVPFLHGFEPLPALYVDRDTGAQLRERASGAPHARLTLTATRTRIRTPSIVGALPGASEETLILNTHTDGQGFVEENCGVVLVQLARYFGSLPPGEQLRRTLVFSLFTGHMDPQLPETQGFITEHPDLVRRAAAAITIEHFGCSEWVDTVAGGYRATGDPEPFVAWTTQGAMFEIVRDAVIAARLPRTALLRPPVQFGVGGAFQAAGVPQVGAIAGPAYLLTVSDNGEMDKLDEALAARQIAWTADLVRRLDGVPAASLRGGDPTLGQPSALGTGAPGIGHRQVQCSPTQAAVGHTELVVRFYGRAHRAHGVVVSLSARGGFIDAVELELSRAGHVVARAPAGHIGAQPRRIAMRRARRRRFGPGRYQLSVRSGGRPLVTRTVRIG